MVKEGIIFVIIPFIIGLVFLLLKIPRISVVIAICMVILTVYSAFFFRDPKRVIVAGPDEIVSPVDGKVLNVTTDGETSRIVVFLSLFNVHITRLPFAGKIEKLDYFKGKFLPAFREKSSELNERMTVEVNSPELKYSVRLIAGIAARRIRMWQKEGAELKSGDKMGILMFGSRAEIFLPQSVEIFIKKGDKVRGGLTLLGKLKPKK